MNTVEPDVNPDMINNNEHPGPGVAHFVAYQEPTGVLAAQIDEIVAVTRTSAPPPAPETPDQKAFREWREERDAKDREEFLARNDDKDGDAALDEDPVL